MHSNRVAILEVAPDLGVRLGRGIGIRLCWLLLRGLLFLDVVTGELVPVFENPHTLAEGLVVPELSRIEGAVGKDPLASGHLPVLPLADKLRAVLGEGVRALAVLLATHPLAHVLITVGVGEGSIRSAFTIGLAATLAFREATHVGTAALWRTLLNLLLLAGGGLVRHLAKPVLLVLNVVAFVGVAVLLERVDALASTEALHIFAVIRVAIQVERLALPSVVLGSFGPRLRGALHEELVFLLLLVPHGCNSGLRNGKASSA